jgi:hypothetical protein
MLTFSIRIKFITREHAPLSSGDEIMSDNGVDMTLLKIVVPLPSPLRADQIEQLANVMLALATNELDTFACAGQRWLIGDGDDTQAAWLANGSLNIWLRAWPNESANIIQQEHKMSERKTHTFEANETITRDMLIDAAIAAQACFIPACVTCSHDVPNSDALVVANADANILHIDADTNDGNLISTLGEIVRAIGEMAKPITKREMNALVVFGYWLEREAAATQQAAQSLLHMPA